MARIFISHASKDDAAVTEVSEWLKAQGFDDHFVDHIDISGGTSWDRELPKQMAQAEIVLLYVTRNWLASSECVAEYRASYYSNKVVIPLLIADSLSDLTDEMRDDLNRILSSIQGISITGFPPDDVTSSLLRGSLVLSSNTIKWARRKRILRRFSISVFCFLLALGGLSFYFRTYLGAYLETTRIALAFTPLSQDELSKAFSSISDLTTEDRIFRDCNSDVFCPDMIAIPSGQFRMGASDDFDPDPSEMPNHVVDVPSFAVSVTEITQAQWQACFVSTQLRETSRCKQAPAWQGDVNFPVDSISWQDAQIYVAWLNEQVSGAPNGPYRLLSEAEWEYAARGQTSATGIPEIYHWGDAFEDACAYANALNSEMLTISIDREGLECLGNPELAAPVASFKPNSFGLYDTAGNLAEWVQDCWHDTYHGRPEGAQAWTLSTEQNCERVIRGGSWAGDIDNLRSAARVKLRDDRFGFNIGFRIARDLE